MPNPAPAQPAHSHATSWLDTMPIMPSAAATLALGFWNWALLLLAAVATALVATAWLRHFVRGLVLGGMPRLRTTAFVSRLRELAFSSPESLAPAISSASIDACLMQLWRAADFQASRIHARLQLSALSALPQDLPTAPNRPAGAPPTSRHLQLRDGRTLVLILFPLPRTSGEPYFVGIVLPHDPPQAVCPTPHAAVRFFVLNKWNLDRPTDFCEWSTPTFELTYNIGCDPRPEAFVELIEQQLSKGPPAQPLPAHSRNNADRSPLNPASRA